MGAYLKLLNTRDRNRSLSTLGLSAARDQCPVAGLMADRVPAPASRQADAELAVELGVRDRP
jgi:hypothetical protein